MQEAGGGSWNVVVMDAGSVNGTRRIEAGEGRILAANEAHVVTSGTVVEFGDARVLVKTVVMTPTVAPAAPAVELGGVEVVGAGGGGGGGDVGQHQGGREGHNQGSEDGGQAGLAGPVEGGDRRVGSGGGGGGDVGQDQGGRGGHNQGSEGGGGPAGRGGPVEGGDGRAGSGGGNVGGREADVRSVAPFSKGVATSRRLPMQPSNCASCVFCRGRTPTCRAFARGVWT